MAGRESVKHAYLYSLNALITELKECGWNDEAEKLIEVRELVWSEDLVFTPSRKNKVVLSGTFHADNLID